MKIAKVIQIIVAISLLCSCSISMNNDKIDKDTISSYSITDQFENYKSESIITNLIDETKIISTEYAYTPYSPSSSEKTEIQNLLLEFKNFSYSYLECKEIKKHISNSVFITTQEIANNGINDGNTFEKKWYKIISGDVITMLNISQKTSNLFTDKMTSVLDINNYYKEYNGSLYLSEFAGNDGSLLGTDITYINSISQLDNDTLILDMIAFGDKDFWELPSDFIDTYYIQIKRTDSGFKVDVCDLKAIQYITWVYLPEKDIFN